MFILVYLEVPNLFQELQHKLRKGTRLPRNRRVTNAPVPPTTRIKLKV